jgi:hypothetical protein
MIRVRLENTIISTITADACLCATEHEHAAASLIAFLATILPDVDDVQYEIADLTVFVPYYDHHSGEFLCFETAKIHAELRTLFIQFQSAKPHDFSLMPK